MKRAVAVAAMFTLLTFTAMAQRGGARGGAGGHASGGFSGHAAGFAGHAGFGGGFASHAGGFASRGPGFAPRFSGFAPRYGFSPRFGSYAPHGFAPRSRAFIGRVPYRGNEYNRQGNTYGANGRNGQGGDHGRHPRHRRPYYNGFNGINYGYAYSALPWYGFEIDPWSLEPDWLDSDDDSNQTAQNQYDGNVPAPYPDYGESGQAYGEPGPEYGEQPPNEYGAPSAYPPEGPEQYRPQAAPSAWTRQPYNGGSTSSAAPQQAVTLIFKNGRAPETVHNYMLTASTMTVLDKHYQQIPIDQINVPATEAANRPAGVNFKIPSAGN